MFNLKCSILSSVVIVFLVATGCSNGDSSEDAPLLEGGAPTTIQDEELPTVDSSANTGLNDLPPLATINLDNVFQLETLIDVPLDAPVNQVILTPNDENLITVSSNRVRIWDAATLSLRHTIETANESIWAIAISPDGQTLLTAGSDGAFERWDVPTGQSIEPYPAPERLITALDYTLAGYLIIGEGEGVAEIRDIQTQAALAEVAWQRGYRRYVTAIASDPLHARMVTGHPDSAIVVWDLPTGERLGRLIGHSNVINDLAFGPDGNLLASTSEDNTVQLWDMDAQTRVWQGAHRFASYNLAFSPDGALLASTGQDGAIRFWNVLDGEAIYLIEGETIDGTVPTGGVSFNADGSLIIYSYADHLIVAGIPET